MLVSICLTIKDSRLIDIKSGWKYYISYCVFLAIEVVFVYFLFPETQGRTLEELAFRERIYYLFSYVCLTWVTSLSVYEDDKIIEQKKRVEEEIQMDEREKRPSYDDVKEKP